MYVSGFITAVQMIRNVFSKRSFMVQVLPGVCISGQEGGKLGARAMMGNNRSFYQLQEPVSTKLGLKVKRSINFSSLKLFFATSVLCSLRLLKPKTEGQTLKTEHLTAKLQN